MERPVVATAMSIGGLQARDGIDLLRDGAEAFAEAVLGLLSNPERRASLDRAGCAVTLSRFACGAMAAQFEVLLEQAARATSRPSGIVR